MIRGPQRIEAINTLEYWGTGFTYAFGQCISPGYGLARVQSDVPRQLELCRSGHARGRDALQPGRSHTGWRRAASRRAPAADSSRQRRFRPGTNPVPGAGFISGSTATPASDALNDRLLQLWMTPLRSSPHGGEGRFGRQGDHGRRSHRHQVFRSPERYRGITLKVTLNGYTVPERVDARTDNPVLGDMVTETTYPDYSNLSEITTDVPFPSHIVEKQGGFPVLDVTVTKADTNNPYVVFPVPDNVEKAPQGHTAVKVETQKVSDGVWYLTGGTHHSVAVEFKNYVALVECPLNDDRADAVIDAVKKTIYN